MKLLAAILLIVSMLYPKQSPDIIGELNGGHRRHPFLVGGRFWKILALVVTMLATGATAYGQAEWWKSADNTQRLFIRSTYDRNKIYNMGFTLAAFSIIESSGGIHLLNISENSGGVYAQKAYRVAQRAYSVETPTDWMVSRALQNLITDREFDDKQARAHIQELLTQHGGRWVMVWSRWNSRKVGQADEIRAWVRFLKQQFKE